MKCVFPDVHWQEDTPQSQGINPKLLTEALNYLESECNEDGIHAMMIVRNGVCIWKGSAYKKQYDVYSCTKSVTSTVLGCMAEDGICSLNSFAWEYCKGLQELYPEVQLKHFASMTSGYNSVGGLYGINNESDGSLTPWQPVQPVFTPPGSFFHYHDNAMRMFGYILPKISGRPLEDMFRERIAVHIGMKHWQWRDYHNNGAGNDPASSFVTTAEEFCRLGLLYLNRGRWESRQVLSRDWIDQACQSQTRGIRDYKGLVYRGIPGGGYYGYNWWVNAEGDSGENLMPDLPGDSFYAAGFNNNRLYIIPKWQTVICRLGVDRNIPGSRWNEFFRLFGLCIEA